MTSYNDPSADEDRELPDRTDMDEEGAPETMPCPYCKGEVHEEAEICHHCGKYISRETSPIGTPVWLIMGAIVCLIIVLWVWMA